MGIYLGTSLPLTSKLKEKLGCGGCPFSDWIRFFFAEKGKSLFNIFPIEMTSAAAREELFSLINSSMTGEDKDKPIILLAEKC